MWLDLFDYISFYEMNEAFVNTILRQYTNLIITYQKPTYFEEFNFNCLESEILIRYNSFYCYLQYCSDKLWCDIIVPKGTISDTDRPKLISNKFDVIKIVYKKNIKYYYLEYENKILKVMYLKNTYLNKLKVSNNVNILLLSNTNLYNLTINKKTNITDCYDSIIYYRLIKYIKDKIGKIIKYRLVILYLNILK